MTTASTEAGMDAALALADWQGFAARKAKSRSRGMLRGIGFANYIEATSGFPRERAEVTVAPEGRVPGGEGGTTPALGAVVNAVVDALSEFGVKHIEMPVTAERVWRAIKLSSRRWTMTQALSGIRVIDMTHNQAGPACAQILGFLGADVIKLEEPKGGDVARTNMRDRTDSDSLFFLILNANKRSLTLNLKTDEGKSAVQAGDRRVRCAGGEFRARRAGPAGTWL